MASSRTGFPTAAEGLVQLDHGLQARELGLAKSICAE